MLFSRRSFLGLLAAPAVIRVADLMPVKALADPVLDVAPRFVVPDGVRLVRVIANITQHIPGSGSIQILKNGALLGSSYDGNSILVMTPIISVEAGDTIDYEFSPASADTYFGIEAVA